MKAAPFDYVASESVEDALSHLCEVGDEGLILAGGQTLVPMLAMRMALPHVLIDINNIPELSGIEKLDNGIRINTCTRQNSALYSSLVKSGVPLLAKALPFVGHNQTRNRGTIGGSLAHGDPAAETPLVAVALDAEITLQSSRQTRQVLAADFYEGPMMSVRKPDECLIHIVFPSWETGGKIGSEFQEVSQRHGDFAVVAAAAQIQLDEAGICQRAALALGGVNSIPIRLTNAEGVLTSNAISADIINDALQDMDAALDPTSDTIASSAYRHRVARVMIERVIRGAVSRAGGTVN